jgi:hypothetical protein
MPDLSNPHESETWREVVPPADAVTDALNDADLLSEETQLAILADYLHNHGLPPTDTEPEPF